MHWYFFFLQNKANGWSYWSDWAYKLRKKVCSVEAWDNLILEQQQKVTLKMVLYDQTGKMISLKKKKQVEKKMHYFTS